MQKALIYCRVSSEKQKREGHGLDSQEHRCRQYADMEGYEIIRVFRDDITGGHVARPAMDQLLLELDKQPDFGEPTIVIMDDISRWARDVMTHFTLKQAIESRNGILKSPNFHFGESPEDRFSETISAAAAEYERRRNRRQVMQKMKARLESGYWSFDHPPGYRYIKDPVHGKLLVPDEPKAQIVREALLGFLSRRFETKTDVQQFLEEKEFVHRAKFDGTVHLEQVTRLLTRTLYAGWIEYPKWSIARRRGHHEGLITIEQFDAIKARLDETERRPQRKDAHKDFPLRNFLACQSCERLVTASWSKGRSKSYPYYRCNTPACPMRNKGIRAEKVASAFEKLLAELRPKPATLKLVSAILKDLWEKRLEVQRDMQKKRQQDARKVDEEIDTLFERLGKINGDILIKKYESRIEQLEQKKREIQRENFDEKDPRHDFGTALAAVQKFMQNPLSLWKSDNFEDKRTVLKLSVLGVLPYDPKLGFGTVTFPLLFQLCKQSETGKTLMVEMPGIEPGSNVRT